MDVSLSNIVEGTRPYFLGVPNASPGQAANNDESDTSSQSTTRPLWSGAAPHTPHAAEAAPAQSGAPAMPNSRPPSVAAVQPPRPPSECLLEPEPHIIHKATVVQQALQKQREQEAMLDSPEDMERPPSEMAMSPPTHIIHKPSHAKTEVGFSDNSHTNNDRSQGEKTPQQQQNAPAIVNHNLTPIPSPKNAMQPPHTPSPHPVSQTPPHPVPHASSPHPRLPTSSPLTRIPTPHSNTNKAMDVPTKNERNNQQRTEHYKPLQYNMSSSPSPTAPSPLRHATMENYGKMEIENEYRRAISHVQMIERQQDHSSHLKSSEPVYRRISAPSVPFSQNEMTYQSVESAQKNYRYLSNAMPTSTSYGVSSTPLYNDRVPPIVHPNQPSYDDRIHQQQLPMKRNQAYPVHEKFHPNYRQIPPNHYSSQQKYSVQTPQNASMITPNRTYDSRDVYRNYPSTKVTSSNMHSSQNAPSNITRNYPDYRLENRNLNSHYPRGNVTNQKLVEQSRPHSSNIQQHLYPPPNRQTTQISHTSVTTGSRSSYSYAYTMNSTQVTTNTSTSVSAVHQVTQSLPNVIINPTYESNSQVSPTRGMPVKLGYGNHQPRMTVSVTSLVNQMNQTKQKRESPLDLSVKTVKNPADSTDEIECRQSHEDNVKPYVIAREMPSTSSYSRISTQEITNKAPNSFKVDFSPNFQSSYSEQKNPTRTQSSVYTPNAQRVSVPVAHQSSRPYDSIASNKPYVRKAPPEPYFIDNSYQPKQKYPSSKRVESGLPRIDLTQAIEKDHLRESSNHRFLEESRKRSNGAVISNIPEKIMRYETWSSDSRLDKHGLPRGFQSARDEQQKLMRQPVYSYSSHKQIEAYHHYENRRVPNNIYQQPSSSLHPIHSSYDERQREVIYNQKLIERNQRPIIQKAPHPRLPTDYNGVPADKNVLSILRNSLETRNLPGSPKPDKPVTIVIDDVEDTVEEIKETVKVIETAKSQDSNVMASHKLQMPKAVDSIRYELDTSQKSIVNDEHQKSTLECEPKPLNRSPDGDFASRIRTKGELKGFTLPVPQGEVPIVTNKAEAESSSCKPKSQKQHLFNQIQQENQSIELVHENHKTHFDELKENSNQVNDPATENENPVQEKATEEDLFWGSMCENFVEQLKSKVIPRKKRKTKLSVELERTKEMKQEPIDETNTQEENVQTMAETSTLAQGIENSNGINIDFTNIKIKEEPISTNEDFDSLVGTSIDNTKLEIDSKRDSNKLPILDSTGDIKSDNSMPPILSEIKKEIEDTKIHIKQEIDSSDDDQPLIKSKILKEKRHCRDNSNENISMKTKTVFVKLENCDFENKKSIENKMKQKVRNKIIKKSLSIESKDSKRSNNCESSPDSDADDVSLASRLRTRKSIKGDESKSTKTLKSSPKKESIALSESSQDKSNFQNKFPGWEEQLYRYKRSLRMPTRLINVPKSISRISSSLPDLDPTPVSPAPSTSTDELFSRRNAGSGCETNDKAIDSDLESDCSSLPKVNYDSETSNSTVFSSASKKKGDSFLDLLIQKYGRKDDNKKRGDAKEDKLKTLNDSSSTLDSRSRIKKNCSKESPKSTKEPLEDLRQTKPEEAKQKEDRLKSKNRNESRALKLRTPLKEVFGDERPASAPPLCSNEGLSGVEVDKKTVASRHKQLKLKKKIIKDKGKLKSNIREGLRSTRSKGNDAKGRLLRLKKRNNLLKALASKKVKKIKREPKTINSDDIKDESKLIIKDENKVIKDENENSAEIVKKKFRRLFARRKLSSGFDYLKKKKKLVRKEDGAKTKKRRPGMSRPSPASINDLQKEIKGWFINKSIGETHLHRAARLGYTDCIAYCLQNMNIPSSCRDNAGFTPLHVAAQRGHLQIAKILLQYGADVSSAAQGGICPLHEACENGDIEMIRLLLSYGADPTLATYSGATPMELAPGPTSKFIEEHIADLQGKATEPWHFNGPSKIFDPQESGCDVARSPPERSPSPPPPTLEFVSAANPLPPLYILRPDTRTYYCLLHDLLAVLQVKSKDALLKQIHSGAGSPKDNLKELKTQEFLERAQCQQFMAAGEKINVRASKIALVPYTDKVKELLDIDTVLVR